MPAAFAGLLGIRALDTPAIFNGSMVGALLERTGSSPAKPNKKAPPPVSSPGKTSPNPNIKGPPPVSSPPSSPSQKGKLKNSKKPRCLPSVTDILKAKKGGAASPPPKPTDKSTGRPQKPVSKPPRKRALDAEKLGKIVTDPSTNVPYNEAKVVRWANGQISGALGSAQFCGCTAVVIWSKKAILIAHVGEARTDIVEDGRWWPAQDMPPLLQEAVVQDQQNSDKKFLDKAQAMIQAKWNAADFPPGETQAIIVGPYNDGRSSQHNTLGVPLGYYYPGQIEGLQRMLRTNFIPHTYAAPTDVGTILEEKYIAKDQESMAYQQAQIDGKDIVAVNIERHGSNYNLILYADGKDTGKYLTLGRAR